MQESTHCYKTLQHTLEQTATDCNTLQHSASHATTLCNALQHTATHCSIRDNKETSHMNQHTLRNTVQHSATQCNTLQHTATLVTPRRRVTQSNRLTPQHCRALLTRETLLLKSRRAHMRCHACLTQINSRHTSGLPGSLHGVKVSLDAIYGAYRVQCSPCLFQRGLSIAPISSVHR